MRTLPPFARAAITNAETVHARSGGISAMQRILRLRAFERAETGEIQPALSLRPGLTIEARTNQTCRPRIVLMQKTVGLAAT